MYMRHVYSKYGYLISIRGHFLTNHSGKIMTDRLLLFIILLREGKCSLISVSYMLLRLLLLSIDGWFTYYMQQNKLTNWHIKKIIGEGGGGGCSFWYAWSCTIVMRTKLDMYLRFYAEVCIVNILFFSEKKIDVFQMSLWRR